MQNMNKAKQGQTFIDMVCQLSGTYEDVVNASVINGVSITDDLTIGQQVRTNKILLPDVASTLKKNLPSTAIRKNIQSGSEEKQEGISFWIINQNFIVQ